MSSKNSAPYPSIQRAAEADFPTEFGHFRIYGFNGSVAPGGEIEEIVAIAMGNLSAPEPLLVRIHSQCLTGDVFHSLRCDCRSQFEIAIRRIAQEGRGMLIYEAKEGRGIGLVNKIRAYQLQDHGHDTVEANVALGFEADLRDYGLPGAVLRDFGVQSVRLMSNNPQKIEALERQGIQVAERVPIVAPALETNEDYLRVKKEKLGHLF